MSFGSPEKNSPDNDIDLDFMHLDTNSPEAKVKDLQDKIAATERGIALAQKLNDPGRVAEMEAKKRGFEATIAEIQSGKPKEVEKPNPANRFDVADMDDITTRRLDARGHI
jgi:hypothetical protein